MQLSGNASELCGHIGPYTWTQSQGCSVKLPAEASFAVSALCTRCVCARCVPSWRLNGAALPGRMYQDGCEQHGRRPVCQVGGQLLTCKVGPHLAQGRPPAGEGAERRGAVVGSRAWAGQRAAGHRGPGATQASVHNMESQCHKCSHSERPDVRWELNRCRSAGVRSGGSPAPACAGARLALQLLCFRTVPCSAGVAMHFKHSVFCTLTCFISGFTPGTWNGLRRRH